MASSTYSSQADRAHTRCADSIRRANAERIALEGFIDWVYGLWRKNPAMHIYHYAPYEITACKRLGGTLNETGFPLIVTVLPHLSNFELGLVVVQSKHEPSELVTLVPNEIVGAGPIPASIDVVVGDIENGTTKHSALLDFLERRPPRIRGHQGGAIVQSPESTLEDTVKAVLALDNSCLIIQGPPGAGKSYAGAHIIAALVAKGKRVGITSNSHAAINNLLIRAASECRTQGVDGHFVCTKNTSDKLAELEVTVVKNSDLASQLTTRCVVGTTAWGFSRDDLAGAFDVLIVDEAGQVAVANLVAMSRTAHNIVVMGDQRQLGQPTQGVHPAESGLSVLDYRLARTIHETHNPFTRPFVRSGFREGAEYRLYFRLSGIRYGQRGCAGPAFRKDWVIS